MLKCTFTLLFVFAVVTKSASQELSLKGSVIKADSKEKLCNALVYMLYAKDSVVFAFTRTNSEGKFLIENIKSGKWVLIVSYPQYLEHIQELDFDSNTRLDMPSIELASKAKMLEEIIVKGKLSTVKLIGDTTEYLTDRYKLPPNSTVEDLLRKLPGLRVSKDGRITAQGEKVNQVFVDGEEFFSNDPMPVSYTHLDVYKRQE